VRKYLLFLYTVPSERIAKSFKPTSIPTEEPVLGSSSTSVSTRIDTKYFPLGLRLTVAFRIRPFTSRLLANFTNPSLGSLILLSTIEIFPFVCLVVSDCTLYLFDFNRGALFCFLKKRLSESARFFSDD